MGRVYEEFPGQAAVAVYFISSVIGHSTQLLLTYLAILKTFLGGRVQNIIFASTGDEILERSLKSSE